MGNETSKVLTMGAVAVVLLMAWQMRSHPVGNVKLPEDLEPVQRLQRVPSSQGPAVTKAGAPKSEKEELVQKIQSFNDCYASEKCAFPQTDPKSYEHGVGQAIRDALEEYRVKYGKDSKNTGEMTKLAQQFMPSTDEFVQEQALEMFTALPPSSENLQAITEALRDTSDPLLVDQAMNEMKRYIGTADEVRVHEYLRELLGRGGVFSSEAAAKRILSFINQNSYAGYEGLAQSLPSNSTTAQNLRTALEEYRRLQTGG